MAHLESHPITLNEQTQIQEQTKALDQYIHLLDKLNAKLIQAMKLHMCVIFEDNSVGCVGDVVKYWNSKGMVQTCVVVNNSNSNRCSNQ